MKIRTPVGETSVRIWKELMFRGVRTIPELSRALVVTFPTIRKNLEQLIDRGVVIELDTEESSGGRPAKRYVHAADIGRSRTHFLYSGLHLLQNVQLKQQLEKRFAVHAVIENMNAAVIGYARSDMRRLNQSLTYLNLGKNGPGAGLLLGGRLILSSWEQDYLNGLDYLCLNLSAEQPIS